MRRLRRRVRTADPSGQARHDVVARARQELGGALDRAKSVMNEAIGRAGLAARGSAQPMADAVVRSKRAVNDALGQLGRLNASDENTAKAVAEAAELTSNAVSAGLGAGQQSLKAAQDGVAAALQATAAAVAEAGRLIGEVRPKAAPPPKTG